MTGKTTGNPEASQANAGRPPEAEPVESAILLLGQDHATWGDFTLERSASGLSTCAISVGADPRSPSMSSKADRTLPNEDALFCLEDGPLVLLAVADAHFGIEASHTLMQQIASSTIEVPQAFDALAELVGGLPALQTAGESSSTLLVAILDREQGTGFGLSFGDSSLVAVSSEGARHLNVRRPHYIHLRGPGPIDPGDAHAFNFFVQPGSLLLAFTDGINECHYRTPGTSIGTQHLEDLFARTGPQPERFARELIQLALAGVDGNPGGEDNIALIVSTTGPEKA